MRAMECGQCGHTMTAKNDESLVKATKAHFAEEHSFLPVTESQIKETVAEKAHEA